MKNSRGQFVKGTHWRPQKPWWNRDWLYDQYVQCRRSASDIAQEGGVGETAILYWLTKHKIKARTMREIRANKHWGLSGVDNPMWNRKGELNPRWMGGITPERQAFYTSRKWKTACSFVWSRDKGTCRRCGIIRSARLDLPFHIHHVQSFANKDLRADPINLVLLCEICHHFIHSKRNKDREYLPKK